MADDRPVHSRGRLGMGPDRALPESVVRMVTEQMAAGDQQRSVVFASTVIELAVLRGLTGSAQIAVVSREERA